MKTPTVGDVVTVLVRDRTVRAEVKRSYKRRFIAVSKIFEETAEFHQRDLGRIVGQDLADRALLVADSFERADEGKKWVRGWDDETSVAFRAEKALERCR